MTKLAAVLHRLGQAERETRRQGIREPSELSVDLSFATLDELRELQRLAPKKDGDAIPERAREIFARIQRRTAHGQPPPEPPRRWPALGFEQRKREGQLVEPTESGATLHVSPSVEIALAFDPRKAPGAPLDEASSPMPKALAAGEPDEDRGPKEPPSDEPEAETPEPEPGRREIRDAEGRVVSVFHERYGEPEFTWRSPARRNGQAASAFVAEALF